jgi:hypothetical protein
MNCTTAAAGERDAAKIMQQPLRVSLAKSSLNHHFELLQGMDEYINSGTHKSLPKRITAALKEAEPEWLEALHSKLNLEQEALFAKFAEQIMAANPHVKIVPRETSGEGKWSVEFPLEECRFSPKNLDRSDMLVERIVEVFAKMYDVFSEVNRAFKKARQVETGFERALVIHHINNQIAKLVGALWFAKKGMEQYLEAA